MEMGGRGKGKGKEGWGILGLVILYMIVSIQCRISDLIAFLCRSLALVSILESE